MIERAPDFALPGVMDETIEKYNIEHTIADGQALLLLFYPFDFSPVCTTELCAIRDAEWFEFTPGLSVWAISGDSVFAHRAFSEEHNLNFPLLSDFDGSVAEEFGVCYETHEEHERVPKRAVFVIDRSQRIKYMWSTDNAYEKPDFAPIKEAVDELEAIDDTLVSGTAELEIDYEESTVSK
jgi:peroxiredoxin